MRALPVRIEEFTREGLRHHSRDGIAIEPPCAEFSLMVCENPIFLTWPTGRSVSVKPGATLLKDVALACHASDRR